MSQDYDFDFDFTDFFAAEDFDITKIKVTQVREFDSEKGIIDSLKRGRIQMAMMLLELQMLAHRKPKEFNNANSAAQQFLLRDVQIKQKEKTIVDDKAYATNLKVDVYNKDCLIVAKQLNELFPDKTALLNMSNRQKVGGGPFRGQEAQEEYLFRMTGLVVSLMRYAHQKKGWDDGKRPCYHPNSFGLTDVLISRNQVYRRSVVENGKKVIKKEKKPFSVHMLSSASLIMDVEKTGYWDEYNNYYSVAVGEAIQAAKIYNQIATAIQAGNEAIVLSAFGCGAFNNPPQRIAELYRAILSLPEFLGKLKVQFAIIGGNPPNFDPFQKVFAEPLKPLDAKKAEEIRAPILAIQAFEITTEKLLPLINHRDIDPPHPFKEPLHNLREKIRDFYVCHATKYELISEVQENLKTLLSRISQHPTLVDIKYAETILDLKRYQFHINLLNDTDEMFLIIAKLITFLQNSGTTSRITPDEMKRIKNNKYVLDILQRDTHLWQCLETGVVPETILSLEVDKQIDRLLRRVIHVRKGANFAEIIEKENDIYGKFADNAKGKEKAEQRLAEHAHEIIGKEAFDQLKIEFSHWVKSNPVPAKDFLKLGLATEEYLDSKEDLHNSAWLLAKWLDSCITANMTDTSEPFVPYKAPSYLDYIKSGAFFQESDLLFQDYSEQSVEELKQKVGPYARAFLNNFQERIYEKMAQFNYPPYTLPLIEELYAINNEIKDDLIRQGKLEQLLDDLYKKDPERKWSKEKAREQLLISYPFAVTAAYFRGHHSENDQAIAGFFRFINTKDNTNKMPFQIFDKLIEDNQKKLLSCFALKQTPHMDGVAQLWQALQRAKSSEAYRFLGRDNAIIITDIGNSLDEVDKTWLRTISEKLLQAWQRQEIHLDYEEAHIFLALVTKLQNPNLVTEVKKNIPPIPMDETIKYFVNSDIIKNKNDHAKVREFFLKSNTDEFKLSVPDHKENITLMATLLPLYPFSYEDALAVAKKIQDKSLIQQFDKIKYPIAGKLMRGDAAIQAFLAARHNADPNYMLVQQTKSKSSSAEWYLCHLDHKNQLIKRNIHQDIALKSLSTMLMNKKAVELTLDDKINVHCTIDKFFNKKKLLKQKETIGTITKIVSSTLDHNNSIQAQAQYVWDEYILPRIKRNEKVALFYPDESNLHHAEALYASYTNLNISLSDIFKGAKGQAPLFKEIALLIEKHHCRDKVHLLPIPGSELSKKVTLPAINDEAMRNKAMQKAMQNAAKHQGAGYALLGIVCELPVRPSDEVKKFTAVTNPSLINIVLSQCRDTNQAIDSLTTQSLENWEAHLQEAYHQGKDKPNDLTIYIKIDALINDTIKFISQLPPQPKRNILARMQELVQQYSVCKEEDKNKEALWVSLVNLCKQYQKSSQRSSDDPNVGLLTRAIAENVDNIARWKDIQFLDQLTIAQKKRDAIRYNLNKKSARITRKMITRRKTLSLKLKSKAYEILRNKILNSDSNVPLETILQEGSKDLATTIEYQASHQGEIKKISVESTLNYKRGMLSKLGLGSTYATSKAKLDDLRDKAFKLNPLAALSVEKNAAHLQLPNVHQIAALIDVDQTLVGDKNGLLNESLIRSLLAAGVTDVYLTTDMTGNTLSTEGDFHFNRMRLKRHLEKLGFRVTITTTGDASYQLGLGHTFSTYFESYYGKDGDTLKTNVEKIRNLLTRYQPSTYWRIQLSDTPQKEDLVTIKALKSMLVQMQECVSRKQKPRKQLQGLLQQYLDLDTINQEKHFVWQDFIAAYTYKLMCMETNFYKQKSEELSQQNAYADTKGTLYEYVLANLPSTIQSVVVIDDKRSCLVSANQANNKQSRPLTTLQVMTGNFIQLFSHLVPVPDKNAIDIQNGEIQLYYNKNGEKIVAFWCVNGEVKQQEIAASELNNATYSEIYEQFLNRATNAALTIKSTDKNEQYKLFFNNFGALFNAYPGHRNDLSPEQNQNAAKHYQAQLGAHIQKLGDHQVCSTHLLYAELVMLRDAYLAKHRKKHHEDINSLIRDAIFILQHHTENDSTRLIADRIEQAFAKEERHYRKPTIGLFRKEKTHEEFIAKLKQPSKDYEYPRLLLGIKERYSALFNPMSEVVVVKKL